MQLKVGELSKRTGVTVRALHHYDSIGLLRPSGRSEGGYRLYNGDDVARLHGIQTLRQMGVPLKEVAQLLDGGTTTLRALLARHVKALEDEVARTQALKERLGVMQHVLARGEQPGIGDWLETLSMMGTLEHYFSTAELKRSFERWGQCAAEWPPLVQAIGAAMHRGVSPDAPEIQRLLQQWLDLATRWMDGDLAFLDRWGTMLREQPDLPLPAGIDRALLDYIGDAVRCRMAVAAKYADPQQLQRQTNARAAWRALVQRGQQLMADHVQPDAQAARELARDWQELLHRTFGNDEALRDRVMAAYENEPVLNAGIQFTPALRRYIEQASGP